MTMTSWVEVMKLIPRTRTRTGSEWVDPTRAMPYLSSNSHLSYFELTFDGRRVNSRRSLIDHGSEGLELRSFDMDFAPVERNCNTPGGPTSHTTGCQEDGHGVRPSTNPTAQRPGCLPHPNLVESEGLKTGIVLRLTSVLASRSVASDNDRTANSMANL
ncbi:hypothetical protein C8Q74DRAFT_749566 [Fomes fomentarius]|nr:hypothetical protein C8Q74DRAFT_749566 [Fomes fomentarius]